MGRHPISVVETAMSIMLAINEVFLDLTSAMCPNTTAPRGRAMNPMAKTPQ